MYTKILLFMSGLFFLACGNPSDTSPMQKNDSISTSKAPMTGAFRSRTLFENPYANIPAQCYIETSYGTQNACLFCHSNAAARKALGNTLPQAGLDSAIGNLQLDYAFGPVNSFAVSPNKNPWENTIFPHKLDEELQKLDINTSEWDMKTYIKQDNWQEAYNKKQGEPTHSDSGIKDDPFRLFPALNPASLPADSDGFVRTQNQEEALFGDEIGQNTGWRSIDFMPYGIFTPHSGSVSGVYIRLDSKFMKDESGAFDLQIYKTNLSLLEKAIQDRLQTHELYYAGLARDTKIDRGLFPLKTEFAHPLHYVDVDADMYSSHQNKFPGLRANRVKEIRYMVKYKMFYPGEAISKDEDAPLYYNSKETWIDNGAGWWMSGFIEDAEGSLRGQTSEELMQCVGCHSSTYGFEPEHFTSGTGNTIDTVWSFARKFADDSGWGEMNYLRYSKNLNAKDDETSGFANMGDPLNREAQMGEYRYFLDHVVGASLFGDMPKSMERYLHSVIQKSNGYSDTMPSLEFSSVSKLKEIQTLRLKLIREFTHKKDYLDKNRYIQSALLYPTRSESLDAAAGYKKVVVTQRYTKGKDYFGEVPFTFKYYRDTNESYTHMDDITPYAIGDIITDRPYDKSETILKGVGTTPTLIIENGDNYDSEYLPILQYPQIFEK
ncbi:hypothetical protein KJ877_03970 [bacterium]|nr:hypothetical protein [bacterium]MBU1989144.1 hypothetical protein [bacterium]